MRLGEKLRYLREVEGTLRSLSRELSQLDVARSIQNELGKSISQSYLSDRERGEAAFDELDADAAGKVFQSASGISGGRSGRISERADFGCGCPGRQAGLVACERGGKIWARCGFASRAVDGGPS